MAINNEEFKVRPIWESDVINGSDQSMVLEANRLKTFKSWPFGDDQTCNKHSMASAGFYHCNIEGEADCVRCFCCFKELDGWDRSDDPWVEHRKHHNNCYFVKLSKPEPQLTIKEFIQVVEEREVNLLNKQFSYRQTQENKQLINCGLNVKD